MMSGDPRVPKMLDGVKVVDLSQSIGGLFCGKLLADFGAEVTIVSDGSGPQLSDVDPARARRWLEYLNLDKTPLTLFELASRPERALGALCLGADLLIESFPSGHAATVFLDDQLESINARLVRVSLSAFGTSGEYASWRSDELVEYAMGGHMYLAGDRHREPLLVPGMQGQLHAGLQAALGALAAFRFADQWSLGQQVSVTALEALLSAHNWLVTAWTHRGRVLHRDASQVTRCKDGFVVFVPRAYNPDLFPLIGQPELVADSRFSSFEAFIKNYTQFKHLLGEWAIEHTRQEIWDMAQALRIACCPVLQPAEAARLSQMQDRDWIRESQGMLYPGGPIRVIESAYEPVRNAKPSPPYVNNLPLSGIKVLDLTSHWAGPLAARHLGDLGADVVKIEYATKPESRNRYYAGDDPQHYHYNRSGYFNKMNRNKRGISLDLSHPRGRDTFLKLVDWADVVIENYSARVMPNLDLGFQQLSQRKPSIIMASISAFGATGSLANFIAFGVNIEGSAGLVANVGYSDEDPFGTGNNYPDPIAGTYAALAILAALRYRDRTGRGTHLDESIQEAGAAFFAESYLGALRGEAPSAREVAPSDSTTIRGVYRCLGDDSWLAVAIRNRDDFPALLRLIGAEELSPEFAKLSADQRESLHAAFQAWASSVDHREGARSLQAIGTAAGPVLKNWEILSDNHLAERGFYRLISHPETGTWPFPGFPWRLSRTPGQIRLPAPLFAQHTLEVLRDCAGLSATEIAELDELGIISRTPREHTTVR